jgi:hypothetical protein
MDLLKNNYKMESKIVSIVIVSWNVKDLILACIQELYEKEGIEIIVVDNVSSDGSVKAIKNRFPEVRLIQNDINVGFARANNQGFKIATGEYIYILNPDTICTYESLNELRETFSLDQQIGIAGPKIYYGNGKIQDSCARKLPTIFTLFIQDILPFKKIFGKKFTNKFTFPYDYEKKTEVEAISGAAMLVKRQLLQRFGGFNEEFIHNGEDLELNQRIRSKGFKIIYNPASSIIHFSGQSSKLVEYRITINGYLSYHRYFVLTQGKMAGLVFKMAVLLIKMPMNCIYYSIKKLFGLVNHKSWKTQMAICRRMYVWKPVE